MAYHTPGIDAIQSGGSSPSTAQQATVPASVTSQVAESQAQNKSKAVEQVSEVTTSKSDDILTRKEDVDDIMEAVEKLNQKLESQNQDMNVAFTVDDESGRVVVRISDRDSGELVRQIPTEETLEFARNVKKGKGLLLNTKI